MKFSIQARTQNSELSFEWRQRTFEGSGMYFEEYRFCLRKKLETICPRKYLFLGCIDIYLVYAAYEAPAQ